jgi:hypothetical protein
VATASAPKPPAAPRVTGHDPRTMPTPAVTSAATRSAAPPPTPTQAPGMYDESH